MGLFGIDHQRQQLEHALDTGRMPHAWLLSGAKGVGKASLAQAFSAKVLGEETLITAGSHPDFCRLSPAEDKTTIPVDTVREAIQFVRATPSLGRWRVLVVDSADDLNISAANALLKVLEEPGGDTLLFLISHQAGRLLPTIRSRCVVLRFSPLDRESFDAAITGQGEAPTHELFSLSGGSPGVALQYLAGGMADVLHYASDFLELLGGHSTAEQIQFAEKITAATKQTPGLWAALSRLWLGYSHRQLKQGAVHGLPYATMLPRWQALEALRTLLRQTQGLHLDNRSAVLGCLVYLRQIAG